MTKKEQLKLINNTWEKINQYFSSVHWGKYGNDLLNLNIIEEREHDKIRPSDIGRGISIKQAGKLFAVLGIVRALKHPDKNPTIKDVIYCKKSVLFSASLVENYREELEKVLQGVNFDNILNIDYCKLI